MTGFFFFELAAVIAADDEQGWRNIILRKPYFIVKNANSCLHNPSIIQFTQNTHIYGIVLKT